MLRELDLLIDLTAMGELAAGSVFAGHRIEDVAGRGGMGVVYRATQLALDRTVALKVIAPGLLEDQTMRARFVRESKVAASIDHPNVIPIYYAGEEDGIAYIAMRYVGGDDIRSLVRREGNLPPHRAARIVAQIGAALDAAHAAGLVHRDIKPANVLLGPEDHVYLTDFGLTKHALSVAGSTKPGHWVGTLDYVAPEQIRGERIDARADIYALGCLLYYTLTGSVPFARGGDEAKLWAHLSEPPPKPSAHGAPEAFDAVVGRAMAKDPDERYPSAGDLGRAALAAAAGRRPLERERLVATGAAAPIEAETVSAARPQDLPSAAQEDDAETVAQERSRVHRARRPALLGVALVAAAGIGVAAAVALGVGDSKGNGARPTPTATPKPTATAAPAALQVAKTLKVGNRPNVARAVGDNVFVGSFKQPKLAIIDASTGRLRPYRPTIGVGVNDSAYGRGYLWLAVSRSHKILKLDPKTGHVEGSIPVDGSPAAIAITPGAVWAGLVSGNGAPDMLLQIDPKDGHTISSTPYPYGIASLAASPSALWVVSRRRARTIRADLKTGAPVHELRVGASRGEDAVYGNGALWVSVPDDDAVYKIVTATGEVVPISVGKHPRQLALDGDSLFVTDYNSSDLIQVDVKTSRLVGPAVSLPVNPYAIASTGDQLWVTSQPDNQVTQVLRGHGG
jgi:outer membrane protein assembly factor BamB